MSLDFEVIDVRAEPFAAVPTLMVRLHIAATDAASVHAVALRCQIRIEPQRRQYRPEEEEGLYELFGPTPQWGESLRPFLWTHVSAMVPGFERDTEFDLPVECSYDFEVTAAKYLHALEGGDIPLVFLFSGTRFTQGDAGFRTAPVSWSSDVAFRLPVATWRELMDQYFPNSGWMRLPSDTIDRLRDYKVRAGFFTWEQAIEALLKEAGEDR